MNAKRKGTAGEREIECILRRAGIRACRNDQIFIGGHHNPDVYAEIADIPLHIEVKRVERLNVSEAVLQAVRDAADGYLPIVAHRRNREQWLITIPLPQLIELLKKEGIIRHDR